MKSKIHQSIGRYYASKRYRMYINLALCLWSLFMIYRLGYAVGEFIYYIQQDFFS